MTSSDVQECATQAQKKVRDVELGRLMVSRNKKVLAGIVVLVAGRRGRRHRLREVGAAAASSKKKDSSSSPTCSGARCRTRSRSTGTLAREEQRKVTTVTQGRVERGVREGRLDRAQAGERLFALDGRDAIAEPGTVRFFRPLDVGDRGDDVLQLKQILAAAGDNPGPMNTVFTEQTRFALAQWQAAAPLSRARRRSRRSR